MKGRSLSGITKKPFKIYTIEILFILVSKFFGVPLNFTSKKRAFLASL